MVTDLNNTGKRKRIYTKHKLTTSETDNILLSKKGLHKKLRRYSNSDFPFLPPKYTSNNSTHQSPKKSHPNNIDDNKLFQIFQDYNTLNQNVITPLNKVSIKLNPS